MRKGFGFLHQKGEGEASGSLCTGASKLTVAAWGPAASCKEASATELCLSSQLPPTHLQEHLVIFNSGLVKVHFFSVREKG